MADTRKVAAKIRESGLWPVVKKRWRAWLRAVHRDIGYLAIGFTVIYAISGIAQNHIEDWGDVSYRTYELTRTIEPIPADAPDAVAIATLTSLVDFGAPISTFRAGDEVRLEYANGAKVTAIGESVTIQGRERRAFIGAANWLHTARQKKGWKYVADAFAVLLLYLAISGIFMIKGKLGFKWRGALLIGVGVAVPVAAVLLSSPDASSPAPASAKLEGTLVPPPTTDMRPAAADQPNATAPGDSEASPAAPSTRTEAGGYGSGIRFLAPEENSAE